MAATVLVWADKTPSELEDFELDWSARLGADTISASTWTVPTGITHDSDTHDNTTTTIWLAGGTDAKTYYLVNSVTTNGGRTFEQEVQITVRDLLQ